MSTPGLARLEELESQFREESAAVRDRSGWDALRLRWVGRKQGLLRDLLGAMRDISPEERPAYGQGVNRLKSLVEGEIEALDQKIDELEKSASRETWDVSLPGRRPALGSLHPVTLISRRIEQIFGDLGFAVAEGPEIENEYRNFEALNIPEGHPARDEQDTLFLESGRLLRTHTSPVQIRTMLSRDKPPIRVICPGRVYRNDNDLRHSPMFHQVELLAVDEGLTFADLRGTLEAFIRRLFDEDTKVRLRPSFFPFTEPSAEVDITCSICRGEGCATCSRTGWIEILGSGMVDPRVLAECGIDPERYSGYAFGLGLDRVAMILWGIPNIRMLFENDERLLRQVQD